MAIGTGTSTEIVPEAHNLMHSEYYGIYFSIGFVPCFMK